jgi:hypothetical protein
MPSDSKSLFFTKTESKTDLAGKRVHLERGSKKISNIFYVPEYLVDAVLDEGFWLCRIAHQGQVNYDLVDLVSGKFSQTIDLANIPAKSTFLAKIKPRKLGNSINLYIKQQNRIISNVFTHIEDSLEVIN